MRRLFLFLASLALVTWGRHILAGDTAAPGVLLRDGLLVVLLGGLLFALNARRPEWVDDAAVADGGKDAVLPFSRRIVAGAGLAAALVGGLWLAASLAFTASDGGLLLPILLWLGGLIVGVAGLNWPQRMPASEAQAGWSVEIARRYLVSRLTQGKTPPPQDAFHPSRRTVLVLLLLLTVVGLFLRLWNFAGLPTECSPRECETALAAMQFLETGSLRGLLLTQAPFYTATMAIFFALFGVSQQSTLLLGLLLGGLFIPLFFAAAVRFARPVTALLGTLLVVFNPQLISLSRHASPILLFSLLLVGVLALRPAPGQRGTPARWAATGVLAGLLLAAPPPLNWLLFLWFVVIGLPSGRSGWLFYYLPLCAAALPRFAAGLGAEIFNESSISLFFVQTASLSAQLIQSAGYFSGASGLLSVLGSAYLLRYIRWGQNWVYGVGLLLVGLPIFATSRPDDFYLLTPFLLLLGIGEVAALDQMVGELVWAWSRLVQPRRIFVGVALLLSVLLAGNSVARLGDLADQTGSLERGGYTAIGEYLYSRFEDSLETGDADATLVLVPQAVLNSPVTQLAARGVLPRAPHIVPLDPVAHLPFTGPPFIQQGLDDLLYILPAGDRALTRYLSQLYPGMAAEPIQDKQGETWALAWPVSRGDVANAQGLAALYYEGEDVGALQEALDVRREGPLDFDWTGQSPLAPPFTLVGRGALYIPQAGSYAFRLQRDSTAHARLALGSPLPDPLVLDTEEGMDEIAVDLAQGFLALDVVARSGAAGGRLSIQWQRPGADWETIPRQALYNGNLALGSGLLADYYGHEEGVEVGPGWDGLSAAPLVARRVEPWLMDNGLIAPSRGVVWRAKLAAPVDGIYIFFANADGPYALEIDGIPLLNTNDGLFDNTSLLLRQGWHDLILRYQPAGTGGIQLRWQPPGAPTPTTIGPEFLAPLPADAATDSLALPSLPVPEPQTAPAQSGPSPAPQMAADLRPGAGGAPPTALPALPFALAWQVGSCGVDSEQFQQPRGVALNLFNGLVYVADQGNRRVILRDVDDGGLVDFYADERFEEPFDVDVNLLGQVFVLDAVSQTIFRFEEPQGTAIAQPSGTSFYRPRGMGMDLSGNFYVADTGGARVVKLSSGDGAVELQLGGPDSLLGQGQPVDVLVLPTGAIYVITAQDGTLWRMDTGESWPAVAPANTFDAPHLAGLPTSSFFLSDPERRLITYFSPDGRPLGQLRSDLFAKPVGVGALVVDGSEVLLAVSDSAACQITLWRAPLDALPQ